MANEPAFDEKTIEKLRLAAEEVAWLTGRGHAIERVGDFVANQHHLGDMERAALAAGTCSEPQYRRRAARELEAEDVAGRPILQTLDGTVRAKDAKAKAEVVKVADVRLAMKKEKQVVSGDAEVLDNAGARFNLVGRVVESIPNAKIVKLQ